MERRREICDRLASQIVDDRGLTADQQTEIDRCANSVEGLIYWINTYVWTYDPRRTSPGELPWTPFDLFERQDECLRWMWDRIEAQEEGILEKSRDVGFSWMATALAVHKWRFRYGFKTMLGSYVEEKVDKIGDPDSLFEKIRLIIGRLPAWMQPQGYVKDQHAAFMRIVNPENGNVITGGVGENIGRGGRSSLVILDEGGYFTAGERVEASIVGNSDCRIWGSSAPVTGMGNIFAKKRFSGAHRPEQIFKFHWTDDPRKTMAWAIKKKSELSATPFVWEAEYEINYSAAVEGVAIPSAWVRAARRLYDHLIGQVEFSEAQTVGGLDVGGGGKGKSVFIARTGPIVHKPKVRTESNTIQTAHWGIECALEAGCARLNYDVVGIGAAVTAVLENQENEGGLTPQRAELIIAAINAGDPPSKVVWPDGRTSDRIFANLKAEAWGIMRDRFQAAFEHHNFLLGANAEASEHPIDEMILLCHSPELEAELSLPKRFFNEKGKVILESKDQLRTRGIKSPDFADALALTLMPDSSFIQQGFYNMIKAQLTRMAAAPEGVG